MRKLLILLPLIGSSMGAFAAPNDEALIIFIKKSCLNTNPGISEGFKEGFINESLRQAGLTEKQMMAEVFHPEADKRLDALIWYYNDEWCEKFAADKASLSMSARRAGSRMADNFQNKPNNSSSKKPSLPKQSQSQPVETNSATFKVRDPHTECLEARDYEGCIKHRKGSTEIEQKRCKGDWCMSSGEKSASGHLLPKGWFCRERPKVISCYDELNFKRVPHKGQLSRYVALDSVLYIYRNPTAGTMPSTTQIGSSTTNCYGNAGSFNCTTQPPATITSPGKAADPGGWVIKERTMVVDCDDKTYATYKGTRLLGKWKRLGSLGRFTNACRNAANLPALSLKL